jgi:two-component system response regulator YesN
MLKLLVVDDEIVILQGIVKLIKEGKTPFTHIESATDADEALELLSHSKVDLIVTDINMPGKNGLELIAEVKERKLCNRFVILTGYDEFEYAKQAIRYRVIDYLLKPINKMEFYGLLRTVANEIFAEKEKGEERAGEAEPSDYRDQEYSEHVLRMINYIEQNYEKDLSLDDLSAVTDLHPNYISYLFKKEIGTSFVHFLRQYRIEKAKELLIKHRNLPVQVVGHQVGYENPQHFMKVFKKVAGCTPGSYREKHG